MRKDSCRGSGVPRLPEPWAERFWRVFFLLLQRKVLSRRRAGERAGARVCLGRCRVQEDEAGFGAAVRDKGRLAEGGLTTESTAGQAIGYKEILEHLSGTLGLDEAIDLIKLRSRRYAKRQLSWFRRDGRVRWINLDETDLNEATELIVGSLGEGKVG